MPRLSLIDRPVKWENSGNEKIFAKALAEIKRYTADDLPAVFAPFAVTINKAMIELPAKFKDRPSVATPKATKFIAARKGLLPTSFTTANCCSGATNLY